MCSDRLLYDRHQPHTFAIQHIPVVAKGVQAVYSALPA